jgi:hypothetical protein
VTPHQYRCGCGSRLDSSSTYLAVVSGASKWSGTGPKRARQGPSTGQVPIRGRRLPTRCASS